MKRDVVLIAHNLRSTHNVGSLLRTAEGLGTLHVYLTGYSPYPVVKEDPRLPHLAAKISRQINKTALGAEASLDWSYQADIFSLLDKLRSDGWPIYALEQTSEAIDLTSFQPLPRLALVVGREVEGIEPEILALCDGALEIPMAGRKESFNVVQAAAMALYHLKFGIIAIKKP